MDVLLRLVPDGEASAEERERLAVRLRGELRGLGPDRLEAVPGDAPPAAAKSDAAGAVALVTALSVAGGVLPSLVGLVQDWLGRQASANRVSLTIDGDRIDVTATPEQQQQLVDAFVRRHQTGGQ